MDSRTAIAYIIGYAFSLGAGYALIPRVLDRVRRQVGQRVTRDTRILGILEATLYTTVWLWDADKFLLFVGLWLGLKTVKEWRGPRWSERAQLQFNTYLIGSAISLLFAVTGARLVEQLAPQNAAFSPWVVPVAVILGGLILPSLPGPDRDLNTEEDE